jgi:hypothetical protein
MPHPIDDTMTCTLGRAMLSYNHRLETRESSKLILEIE